MLRLLTNWLVPRQALTGGRLTWPPREGTPTPGQPALCLRDHRHAWSGRPAPCDCLWRAA